MHFVFRAGPQGAIKRIRKPSEILGLWERIWAMAEAAPFSKLRAAAERGDHEALWRGLVGMTECKFFSVVEAAQFEWKGVEASHPHKLAQLDANGGDSDSDSDSDSESSKREPDQSQSGTGQGQGPSSPTAENTLGPAEMPLLPHHDDVGAGKTST